MTAYRAGFWLARRGLPFSSKYSIGSVLWRNAKAGYAFGETGQIEPWCYSQEELVDRAVRVMAKHGPKILESLVSDAGLRRALSEGFEIIHETKPWVRNKARKK